MIRSSCHSTRLGLQTLNDLSGYQREPIERHTAVCSKCAHFATTCAEIDDAVGRAIQPVGGHSVRDTVLATLQNRVEVRRLHRPVAVSGRRRLGRTQVIRFVALIGSLLLALGAPRLLSRNGDTVSLAGASVWHIARADISFHLAADAGRPDHLLVGARGRIYESWNAGDSWHALHPLPHALVIRAVLVDPTQARRYVVATRHSLYISIDRGRHWTESRSSLPGASNMFLVADPQHPGTMYVGPSVLWKSSDHGRTWQPSGTDNPFAPNGIQSLTVGRSGELVSGIWGGGVAVSRDGGRTWLRRAMGLRKNVMDVAETPRGRLLAATDRGLFSSDDSGRHWAIRQPRFTTSILAGRDFLLAGAANALARSDNEGRTWQLFMDGLPSDPYVNGLVADPFHSHRVFATLNGEGVFRSDDAGRHWVAINHGIPLSGRAQQKDLLLFRRDGALWITDSNGSDPGLLTVERDVRLAALAPGAVAAAYVAWNGQDWAVRVLAAGGSAVRTVATGAGSPPSALAWSDDSSHLAIARQSSIDVVDSAGTLTTIRTLGGLHELEWDRTGTKLLGWASAQHEVLAYPLHGPGVAESVPRADTEPRLNRGRQLAWLQGGSLRMSSPGRLIAASLPIRRDCRLGSWSDDGARFLVVCRGMALSVNRNGVVVWRAGVARSAQVDWVPGSHRRLLIFDRGKISLFAGGGTGRTVVRNAEPIPGHL